MGSERGIAGPDLLDEVRRLKQAEGGDVPTWGTGRLTDALAAAGLLDEYRVCTAGRVRCDELTGFSSRRLGEKSCGNR